MQSENGKIGFFKSVLYSITNIEKYPEMAAQGIANAIKYLMKIMLIFSVLVCIGLTYQFYSLVNQGVEYARNELPDANYEDGILTVDSEEAIIIKNEESVINNIIIDTNTEDENQIDEYVNSIPEGESGVIILKNKLIVKTNASSDATVYNYADVVASITSQNIETATKEDMLNYVTGNGMTSIYVMYFILMYIYIFIIYFMSVLVDTVILAILGNITTLITKLKIRFSAIYSIAVYALTLSVILNGIYILVNMTTGFEMKYFQVMYTSIAYIYLVATILIIKSDLIKKQGELMRIIDEQQKVREEMDEKEQQTDRGEEKKKDKEDDGEKEDKDSEKEPDGSGA